MPTPCSVYGTITLVSTRTQCFSANGTSSTLQVLFYGSGSCARGRKEVEGEVEGGLGCYLG